MNFHMQPKCMSDPHKDQYATVWGPILSIGQWAVNNISRVAGVKTLTCTCKYICDILLRISTTKVVLVS